jgi:hypothetical protein
VDGVTLRNSRAATVHVAGKRTRKVRLVDTESVVETDSDVAKDAVVR